MVQVNVSKSTLRVISLISAAGIFIMLLLTAVQLWKTKAYSPVEATLVEVIREVDSGHTSDGKTTVTRYYQYAYRYDDMDYTYTTRSFFGLFHRMGTTSTLYVDAGAPDTVRDTFLLESYGLAALFLGAFLFFSLYAVKYAKPSQ